jgi:hypothetical protein
MDPLSQYHVVDEATGNYTGVVSLADSDEEL